MKKIITLLLALSILPEINAQFHTLKVPQASNQITVSQRLAVTDITIKYHSPSARGRDVWNDTNIIPQNGNPIPWRAGANMNTTIEFTTDVFVEGKELKAGVYGFHIIPKGETYTLLFAHGNNQWGSYYLDVEKDITLSVDVSIESAQNSEKLDYEFLNWKEDSVTIGLEWGDKRIPFKVSVDLNKTVIDSFRSELRGINTYHWQAWNDAANWCLNHNTNLEEALQWANRSIKGGYGGFAANKNFENVFTKIKLLKELNRMDEYKKTVKEMSLVEYSAYQSHRLVRALLYEKQYNEALSFSTEATTKHAKVWYLILNRSLSNYFTKNTKKALKDMKVAIEMAPKQFKKGLEKASEDMKKGTYALPS